MAIQATIKEVTFGSGDVIKVHQRINELNSKGENKTRVQVFEGTVIGIRNRDAGKSFVVRKIGAQNIGIEQIFPLNSPIIEKIEIVKEGTRGARQSKLYYIREKSKREIDRIYSRAKRRGEKPEVKKAEPKKTVEKKTVKKTVKKSSKASK